MDRQAPLSVSRGPSRTPTVRKSPTVGALLPAEACWVSLWCLEPAGARGLLPMDILSGAHTRYASTRNSWAGAGAQDDTGKGQESLPDSSPALGASAGQPAMAREAETVLLDH